MKKIIPSILVLFIVCIIAVTPVFAAGEGNLSAKTILDKSQSKFTVEVSVNNNPGFIAVSLKMEYDNNSLKLTSVDNGSIFSSIYMKGQHMSATPYKVIFMEATAPENITTNGVLVKYTFEVLDTAKLTETEIKFSVDDLSVFGVSSEKPTFTDCSVKLKINGVSTTAPEENNNDQAVNEQDALTTLPDNETVTVLKPEGSSEDFSSTTEIETSSNPAANTKNSISKGTLVTIITLAAVAVIGTAITVTAVYYKRKNK